MVGSKETALAIQERIASAEVGDLQPPVPARKIYAHAGANQPVIGLLPEGKVPAVLDETSDWTKAVFEGMVGCVAR